MNGHGLTYRSSSAPATTSWEPWLSTCQSLLKVNFTIQNLLTNNDVPEIYFIIHVDNYISKTLNLKSASHVMKKLSIVVCLKQVPETTEVKMNPATNTLIREGVESIINPFDLYAIEEAVRIKERNGSGKITALTMGPPQAEQALKEAIALGCDDGILVSDRAFAGSDTWATSYTLAKAIEKIDTYDLILCGQQAIDGDTAQVGPGIACHLNLPQIMYVKKIEELNETFIRAERMTEEGYDIVESPLPAVIAVVKEINEPRIPSLRGKLKAKKTQTLWWKADDLTFDTRKIGLDGSPTQVIKIFTPPPREGGQILNGNLSDAVDTLYTFLKNEIL